MYAAFWLISFFSPPFVICGLQNKSQNVNLSKLVFNGGWRPSPTQSARVTGTLYLHLCFGKHLRYLEYFMFCR